MVKYDDRNSKYFHATSSQRRARNYIPGLISSHGDWCTDNDGMTNIMLDYFESLFTSDNPIESHMQPILDILPLKVDDHINSFLCAPFTADEVKHALFDMHPDKAPGLDGLYPLFYQKFWHVIGRK